MAQYYSLFTVKLFCSTQPQLTLKFATWVHPLEVTETNQNLCQLVRIIKAIEGSLLHWLYIVR